MLNTYTIEDYLDILLGFHGPNFSVDPLDTKLLHSLHNQINRSIALTDRQYELLKLKLNAYSDQYKENGYENIDLSNTRLPIRVIDRSRWIKTLELEGQKYIAVRFTFNKKLLGSLEKIKKLCPNNTYDKENKIHFFAYNETSIFNTVDLFQPHDFEIEEQLLEKHKQLKAMNKNKNEYVPGIYNFKIKNLNQHAFEYMISSLGEPNHNNLGLYKDRRYQVGLHYFDENELDQSLQQFTILAQKIAKRKKRHIFINSKIYQFDRVVESILELDRFPMLILIPTTNSLEYLSKCYEGFKNVLPNKSNAVLFRKDNDDEESEFNQFVKDNKLNNTVDHNTKLVYITDNKIPKPLLKSTWRPSCVLAMQSLRFFNRTEALINQHDLIIHYDNQISPFVGNAIEEI